MPLSQIQSNVLRIIAANRSEESYLAGATVLHRHADSIRFSQDVDLFHDLQEQIACELVGRLPPEDAGCLYLDANQTPVTPDPESLEFKSLTRHAGRPYGAWPKIQAE